MIVKMMILTPLSRPQVPLVIPMVAMLDLLAVVILVTVVKYTPAGVVHRGEYVITKEATSRLGLAFFNHLNYGRGYATGGAVGSIPSTGYRPMAGGSISRQSN